MIKALLTFSLTRRAIVVLGVIVFLAAGAFSFSKLNIEAYPNPAPTILEITAQQAGLSAEEMEKYYTIPMEIGLYPTPGIDNIRSTSFYGLSFVRVTFKYGVDYHFAFAQAAVSLQQNVNLPGNQIPQIQQSSLTGEIFRYEITGPQHFGLTNLRTIEDWVVARRLLTIPGVVQINAWGGTTKEFHVELDPAKLEAYNVTIPQVITALGNANINVGGREITIGQQSINIRGVGLIDDGGNDDLAQGDKVKDIEEIVLSQVNGVPIQIRNLGKVTVGYVPRLGIAGRDNNDDVAAAIVVMGRTQHTNDILPKVQKEVAKINSDGTLPPGVKVVPYYDRGELVGVTTHTVMHNLVFGCLLVFFIQWIFLGDLRSAIIVAANIPFALFFAIMILVAQGEDANLLSVGAVDFGIIVDSAVILVENIFRNFQLRGQERQTLLQHLFEGYWGPNPTALGTQGDTTRWTNRLRLILISALQVDKAVFFTAAITVTAFLPLFTMTGVEGQIFGPMARTYAYALTGALFATFTVAPVMASLVLPARVQEHETIVVRAIRAIYSPVLKFSLDNVGLIIAIGLLFLALGGALASRLGSEFLPALEEGNYWIRASMPPTISLAAGSTATNKMREILLRHKEIVTVVSQHGRPDNGSDASPLSNVELFAPLLAFDKWPAGLTKEKLTAQLQKEFAEELPGVGFNFSQYIQDNVEEALSGVKGANSVKIVGPNLAKLEEIANQVQDEMAKVRGVSDLGIFHVLGQPNLNVKINRAKAARYGLNTGDVNTVVQAALGGASATTVLEGDRTFNLSVRLLRDDRNDIDAVKAIKVAYANGNGSQNSYVPLSELATVSLDTGASYIYRERSARFIPIKFSVRGRDLGSTVAEAQERIAKAVKLPTGYRILWAGEFEDLQAASARLKIVLPITLALILVLLYGLFNTLRDSLLAMAGIPFAVVGGIIALYVSGLDFSVSAAIGFISLFGVAVMDGILNITYYRELRIRGMGVAEAVFYGAEQRMRPMLMTALSAGVGLFPAAISSGIGSQVQKPLATVVVGGMIIGPIMLLVVAPAIRKFFLRKDEIRVTQAPSAAQH
ncbi:efflux RND transporter permease subunit [Rhodoblastus sp.]|uniref:efflux RND transporter permease subunit n=1 Tax=Rhodoblastus sp. TaxID=1962975 RepID=UPI003F9468D1